MKLEWKKLTPHDLDTFIDMRIRQLSEEGSESAAGLRQPLYHYYTTHMRDGSFTAWLAVDQGKIVGTSGMSFVEKPPYPSNPSGKIGLLSSMYTLREYRRRGIARELLNRVVAEARNYGCGTVQITASDMGMLLYSDSGFQQNDHFMQLIL